MFEITPATAPAFVVWALTGLATILWLSASTVRYRPKATMNEPTRGSPLLAMFRFWWQLYFRRSERDEHDPESRRLAKRIRVGAIGAAIWLIIGTLYFWRWT